MYVCLCPVCTTLNTFTHKGVCPRLYINLYNTAPLHNCVISTYAHMYLLYCCVQQKAKAEITAMEMTYGSNPGSPTKRKAAAVTPANLPPKIRKV